ncbi:MAG: hypothetical protein P4L96_05095 [Rhodoferax sp.]|nr:hypothetical protein [Rhodoferax sp.]
MHKLMFAVGSLGVAISAVLLLIAVLGVVFIGHEFSGLQKLSAVTVACVVGFAWWRAMMRSIKRRAETQGE